jgi:Skp family chaperone for outer membrane proteins
MTAPKLSVFLNPLNSKNKSYHIMKTSALTTVCALSLLGFASLASAQTPPTKPASAPVSAPAPAQPATKPGPVIAGVCIYSNDAVMQNADVSKAAGVRLNQINTAAEAELAPQVTALQKEGADLQALEKTTAKEKFGPMVQAFLTKRNDFADKAFIVSQELSRTEKEANRLISQVVSPILTQTYEAKGCGMLVDRSAVLFANPAMDITGEVIQRLNAAKPTIDLKRQVISEADRQKLLKLKAEQDAQQQGSQ